MVQLGVHIKKYKCQEDGNWWLTTDEEMSTLWKLDSRLMQDSGLYVRHETYASS